SLLYGVPTIWNLDLRALREHGARIKKLYAFFAPIHERIGDQRLSNFEWLSGDRKVQRATFSDQIALTANFGDHPFKETPSGCIEANWLKENRIERFCP